MYYWENLLFLEFEFEHLCCFKAN